MASKALVLAAVLAATALGGADAYLVDTFPATIESFDGTKLRASYFRPIRILSHERFPLVVMSNSWGIPGIEYTMPALTLASRGYVVVQYETRGFFFSGGTVGLGGENDVRDHSVVIDWAAHKFDDFLVQPLVVGSAGISYGAGMALLSAVNDTRVKTVAAMSGWGSLMNTFYWNEAPSLYCMEVLLLVGKATGRTTPVLTEMLDNLIHHKNVSMVREWADIRSPLAYIDQINARTDLSILLANGLGDDLFHSHMQLELFEQLKVPKRLLLNPGWHAEWELTGLLPLFKNYVWDAAYDFLDNQLKGAKNNALAPPLVAVALEQSGLKEILPSNRQMFTTWPAPEAELTKVQYQLTPRAGGDAGFLREIANGVAAATAGADNIVFTKRTKMNNGFIPPLTSILEPFLPNKVDLKKLDRRHELVYYTEPFASGARVCGIPTLRDMRVVSNSARFQMISYLYRVPVPCPILCGNHSQAELMSHSPFAMWEGYVPGTVAELPPLEFRAACVDVRKNERLALGFNMYNTLFSSANTTAGVDLAVSFDGAKPLKFEIPFAH